MTYDNYWLTIVSGILLSDEKLPNVQSGHRCAGLCTAIKVYNHNDYWRDWRMREREGKGGKRRMREKSKRDRKLGPEGPF